MIRITDQYFWSFIFLLFFAGLSIMGLIILDSEAYKTYADITLIDISLIALASYRLMHFFAYDGMTKFLREQLYDAKVTKAGKVTLHVPAKGPRRTLITLIYCPWCFGLWNTAVVTFLYLLSPAMYVVVFALAVATVVSTLHLVIERIGDSEV